MLYFFELSIFIAFLLAPVTPYNFKDHEEGSCGQHTPSPNFDNDLFFELTFRHIPAGNKYHMYRITSGVPDHQSISEEDFVNNACLQGITNRTTIISELFGFGLGNIASFQIKSTGQNGVLDAVQLNTPEQYVSRYTVTLIDYEKFVFFANCWEADQQRGWQVISATPTLDATTQQLITEHATSLGFDLAEFVFLSADSCGEK